MSELLGEEDYRAFDRSIGMEAAQSVNALVSDSELSYEELQTAQREGRLAPHVGAYLVRAEETVDRHIGRRDENDQLFAATGQVATRPTQLEPWSPHGAAYANTRPLTEERLERRAALQQKLYEVTEPKYAAFLDKLPQQRSRWSRADKPIQWTEHDEEASVYNFTLTPTKDRSLGYSSVDCYISTLNTYLGVRTNISAKEGRVVGVQTHWANHMDQDGEKVLINTLAPGLLEFRANTVINNYESYITVDVDQMSMTITGMGAMNQTESMTYAFDDDQNMFIANKESASPLTPDQFVDIMQKILNLVPTIEVSNT